MGKVLTINGAASAPAQKPSTSGDDAVARLERVRWRAAQMRALIPSPEKAARHYQYLWFVEILLDLGDYSRDQELTQTHLLLLETMEELLRNQ